jgi:hypothetical protein
MAGGRAAVYRIRCASEVGEIVMTIADLAGALRGIPRSARLLIDTPEGLKDLRWVSPTHVYAAQGVATQVRATEASTAGDNAIVLYPEGRQP